MNYYFNQNRSNEGYVLTLLIINVYIAAHFWLVFKINNCASYFFFLKKVFYFPTFQNKSTKLNENNMAPKLKVTFIEWKWAFLKRGIVRHKNKIVTFLSTLSPFPGSHALWHKHMPVWGDFQVLRGLNAEPQTAKISICPRLTSAFTYIKLCDNS